MHTISTKDNIARTVTRLLTKCYPVPTGSGNLHLPFACTSPFLASPVLRITDSDFNRTRFGVQEKPEVKDICLCPLFRMEHI